MANDAHNPILLIVDTAPAMAQVLKTYANQNNFEADIFSDSAQACAALADRFTNPGIDGGYDCMVLGWPEGEARIISDLLIALASEDNSDLPLIVLSEQPDKELQTLARRRAKTRTLLWRDYKGIEKVLTGIVNKEGPVRKSPSIVQAPAKVRSRLPTSILLVDESPAICYALRDMLESNGYFVALANSAEAVRTALAKNNFDLVLTEFFLRGESGEDLCQYLQSLSPEKRPVYAAMTRKNFDGVVQRSLALGAIACLDKTESTEILFARLNAIATGLSSRVVSSVSVPARARGIADLLDNVKGPSLLIGDRRVILAANKEAANLLSDGDTQVLQRKNFEKTIHGAPVKRSLEGPVKALFRTLDGKSLSVAYRSRDIDVTEYGLAEDVCMLTFESVESAAAVISVQATSDSETVGSIASVAVGQTDHVPVISVEPAQVAATQPVETPASESVHTQIKRALKTDGETAVYSLLMLDMKMVASVTGDRLSLGHSKPLRDMVEVELAKHCKQKEILEYIGNGRYLVLYLSDRVAQSRSLAEKLVGRVPKLVSQLTDVELLSHASFIELPRRSDLSVSYMLKHCTAACMKNELDGLDNKIYYIDALEDSRGASLEMQRSERTASVKPDRRKLEVYEASA